MNMNPRELNFENSEKTKVCNFCGEQKQANEYYKNYGTKCKECALKSAKLYRKENKVKTQKYARERYRNNPKVQEKVKIRARESWRLNKEKHNELRRQRRRKAREKLLTKGENL